MSNYVSSISGVGVRPMVLVQPNRKAVLVQTNSEEETSNRNKMSTGKKIAVTAGIGLGIAALEDFVFFKGKYSKKIYNSIKNLFKKPTKGASSGKGVTGTGSTATTGTTNNTNLTPVDTNTRNLVVKAEQNQIINNAPTYQPPNPQQRQAIEQLHQANQIQRAELNSIGSRAQGAKNLEQVAANINAENAALNQIGTKTITHANGNVYHIENGNVVKVDLYNKLKDGTSKFNRSIEDTLNISKHLSKQGVSFT